MKHILKTFPLNYFESDLPEAIEKLTPSFSYEHPGIYTFQGTQETRQCLQIFATPFWNNDNTIPVDSTHNQGETTVSHGNIQADFFTGDPIQDAKTYIQSLKTHLIPFGIHLS